MSRGCDRETCQDLLDVPGCQAMPRKDHEVKHFPHDVSPLSAGITSRSFLGQRDLSPDTRTSLDPAAVHHSQP